MYRIGRENTVPCAGTLIWHDAGDRVQEVHEMMLACVRRRISVHQFQSAATAAGKTDFLPSKTVDIGYTWNRGDWRTFTRFAMHELGESTYATPAHRTRYRAIAHGPDMALAVEIAARAAARRYRYREGKLQAVLSIDQRPAGIAVPILAAMVVVTKIKNTSTG